MSGAVVMAPPMASSDSTPKCRNSDSSTPLSSPWAPQQQRVHRPSLAQADGDRQAAQAQHHADHRPAQHADGQQREQREPPRSRAGPAGCRAGCRPASVPCRSPARRPPRPCRAARRPPCGTSANSRYSAASASTITSGAHSSPASAASAPRQPKKRSPMISAMLTMLGPGSTWPSDSSSRNCAGVSQRWRSTSSRCATASTPPKPCSARRLKTRKISAALAGRRSPRLSCRADQACARPRMRRAAHRLVASAARHPGQRHPAQAAEAGGRRSSRRRWPSRRTGPGTWPRSSAQSAPWPAPVPPAPAGPAAPSWTRSSPAPRAR